MIIKTTSAVVEPKTINWQPELSLSHTKKFLYRYLPRTLQIWLTCLCQMWNTVTTSYFYFNIPFYNTNNTEIVMIFNKKFTYFISSVTLDLYVYLFYENITYFLRIPRRAQIHLFVPNTVAWTSIYIRNVCEPSENWN